MPKKGINAIAILQHYIHPKSTRPTAVLIRGVGRVLGQGGQTFDKI